MKNVSFFDNKELAIKYLEKCINIRNKDLERDDEFYYNKVNESVYSNNYQHYVIIKHRLNTELD